MKEKEKRIKMGSKKKEKNMTALSQDAKSVSQPTATASTNGQQFDRNIKKQKREKKKSDKGNTYEGKRRQESKERESIMRSTGKKARI